MNKRKRISAKLGLFCAAMSFGFAAFSQGSLNHRKETTSAAKGIFDNSHTEHTRPLVSGDGQTLYFCRRNYIRNTGGKEDFQDVWTATLKSKGIWGEPKKLTGPVNTPTTDAIFGVAQDGHEMIILNKSLLAENPLAYTQLVDGEWTEPTGLKIENFINTNDHFDAHYSKKNDVIVLAIETDNSIGDQDLYVSFRKDDNTWSEPTNLGIDINTTHAEFAPFLGADGKTLFFTSYGLGKDHNSEIYFTRRLDDSWKRWSEPKRLGKNINTDKDEIFISVTDDFEEAFFESLDPKTGERKMSSAKLPDNCKPDHNYELAATNKKKVEISSTNKSLQEIKHVN